MGLVSSAVYAQNAGPGSRGRGADARSPRVTLQGFELAGEGCPNRGSTAVTAQQGRDRVMLEINFERNRPQRFFQVSGPGDQTRTCTAGVILAVGPSQRPMDIQLERARQGVRFESRRSPGQLVVRSQFRLGSQVSAVRSFQVANTPEGENRGGLVSGIVDSVVGLVDGIIDDVGPDGRRRDVVLDNLGLRAPVTDLIEVGSILQLEALGQNQGLLRLQNIELQLRLQPGAVAALAEDEREPVVDNPISMAPVEPVAAPVAPPAAPEPVAVPEPIAAPEPMAPAAPAEPADGSGGGVDRRGFAPN